MGNGAAKVNGTVVPGCSVVVTPRSAKTEQPTSVRPKNDLQGEAIGVKQYRYFYMCYAVFFILHPGTVRILLMKANPSREATRNLLLLRAGKSRS
jgi:hypothetical protein